MNCPVCQTTMIIIEYKKIELDYCMDCMGVWFDAGEIELLLDLIVREARSIYSGEADLHQFQHILAFQPPARPVTEARRPCPICNHLMEKVSPEHQTMIVDRCPKGDGIWFDANEIILALQQTISQNPDTHATDIYTALESFLYDTLSSATE